MMKTKQLKFASLLAVGLLVILLGAGLIACGRRSNVQVIDTPQEFEALLNQISDFVQAGQPLDTANLPKCFAEEGVLFALNELASVVKTNPEVLQPSITAAAAQSALSSGEPAIELEEAEAILNLIGECKDIEKQALTRYKELSTFVVNPACSESEFWEKVTAADISKNQFTPIEAEKMGVRVVDCSNYEQRSQQTVKVAYPWFDWECLVDTTFFMELKAERAREFARTLFKSNVEYVPTQKWSLTLEEVVDSIIPCINQKEVADSLRQRNANEGGNASEGLRLQNCVKRRLAVRRPNPNASVQPHSLIRYLGEVSERLPNCAYG